MSSPRAAFAILGSGVTAATPLLLCSAGETLGESAGVINIGIEGEMLLGAFAAFSVSRATGSAAAGLAAAATAGLLASALFALASIRGRSDQIVTGTAVNLVVLGGSGLLLRSLPEHWMLAPPALLSPRAGSLTGLDLFALALPLLTFGFLFRTSWGLRLRSVGESIEDSSALKIPVSRYRTWSTLAGGVLAGLAGASLTLELSDSFVEGMSAGRGFLALALVAFGRWNPIAVAIAAILFGLLQAVQYQLQAAGLFHLPSQALLLLPYVFSLIALAGFSGKRLAPADLGKPE
jgi:ABC-type uncharacterized transport system permease subunit